MSETTGPKPTDEQEDNPALLMQKALGIEDGTTVTIVVNKGNIQVSTDRAITAAAMGIMLQAGFAAFEMQMERMLSSPNLANKH